MLRRAKRKLEWTFPFLWVVEGAVTGATRTHAHLLAPARAVDTITAAWAYGNAKVTTLETADDKRAEAAYLTKDLPTGSGQQIRTAKGFKPKPERADLADAQMLGTLLWDRFGKAPTRSTRPAEEAGIAHAATFFFDIDR